ncbi:MAG: hypothetical protein ABT15_23985 [Pseudonocardia sp. SCN 73-27]|nr:MAG: hypothetical protein ABT15_23985 [Pseudonocardia sp. SCN 73-27]
MAAVVLEAGEVPDRGGGRRGDDLSDSAARAGGGGEVERADPVEDVSVGVGDGGAEQLEPGAHGEHDVAVGEFVAHAVTQQPAGGGLLRSILAAAEDVDVRAVWGHVVDRDGVDAGGDAA